MLERIEHDHGVVTYASPLLREVGVKHAFTTRIGGYSRPPYDSLNLGVLTKAEGDANTSISANFRRVRAALGLERIPRYEVRQVHEAGVWDTPPKPVAWTKAPCADALFADAPRKLLCIRVADCVPILLASSNGRRVAAVHAGWRGLVAGVIEAACAHFGEPPLAAIGPCIRVEHFEVGDEVARQFPENCIREFDGRKHVDLVAAVVGCLHTAGVTQIDTTDRCTYRDADEFFSHRRDVTHRGQPDTGRMAALITASG